MLCLYGPRHGVIQTYVIVQVTHLHMLPTVVSGGEKRMFVLQGNIDKAKSESDILVKWYIDWCLVSNGWYFSYLMRAILHGGAGTAYPSGASEFTPRFLVGFVLLDL